MDSSMLAMSVCDLTSCLESGNITRDKLFDVNIYIAPILYHVLPLLAL